MARAITSRVSLGLAQMGRFRHDLEHEATDLDAAGLRDAGGGLVTDTGIARMPLVLRDGVSGAMRGQK